MIKRYTRKQMGSIWTDENRYMTWLKVETEVCAELARKKIIPAKDWKVLQAQLKKIKSISFKEVEAEELITKHDVVAFTTILAKKVGPTSRYIHFGMTSSDIVDTALSIIIGQAGSLLIQDIGVVIGTLKKLAIQYKKLPTIGRTHGMSAEPTSFGLKFLSWYCEFKRGQKRLATALEGLRVGKLSGAVGAHSHFGVHFESQVLRQLGLKRELVSTQILPRDKHAEFFSALAILGGSIERIAIELRHLQRTEVGEVIEYFSQGQKGSSAMPHKRNPITSENLTGVSRLLRGYLIGGLENIALWHERDISHSSVERVIFPDATILMDYAVNRLNSLLRGLSVQKDRVLLNLKQSSETVYSGHLLLALCEKGISREVAYSWLQQCALDYYAKKGSFLALLLEHKNICSVLSASEIREKTNIKFQLRNIESIYVEAFKETN